MASNNVAIPDEVREHGELIMEDIKESGLNTQTLTITEPNSVNQVVRDHLDKFGCFTVYAACPQCGMLSSGFVIKVDDDMVMYTTRGLMCGHKTRQFADISDTTDFNRLFNPVL